MTGALSDRWGRKWLIVGGMGLQAVALAGIALADSFAPWAVAAVLLGAGTAMVYPTLLAAIGDVAHPAWRARSVGIYRLWRDGGFAVGALLAGVVADALGVRAAVWVVAVLTAASGAVVAIRMYETRHDPATSDRSPAMGDRTSKDALFAEFAAVGQGARPPRSASSCSTCSPRDPAASRTWPRPPASG